MRSAIIIYENIIPFGNFGVFAQVLIIENILKLP